MPLLWLSLAFLAGLLAAALLPLGSNAWLLGAALAALLAAGILVGLPGRVLARLRPGFRAPLPARLHLPAFQAGLPLAALLPLLVCLGAARYASTRLRPDPGTLAWYNDRGARYGLEGVVSDPPDRRETHTNLTLEIETLYFEEEEEAARPVRGRLLARLDPGAPFRYGDRLRLDGAPETPFENEAFSYRDYLARQGIHTYLSYPQAELLSSGGGSPLLSAIYRLKERLVGLVYRFYPEPEASLLSGILLGADAWLPGPVEEAFQETGAAHVIAISGFNMTIVAGLFVSLFSRLPALAVGRSLAFQRRLGAGAAALGLAGYTLLVGAGPAVTRAALMGGLALFARQLGRRQSDGLRYDPRNGLNSLALTAAVLALFNPLIPWDAGFQLSFTATLGLVLFGGPLAEGFERLAARRLPQAAARRLAGPVGEYLLFTFAAQLASLPVTLYHFGRLSPVSLLVNPFILPAQPAIMLLGGLSLLLGLLSAPLGQAAAALAWPFAAYTIRAVEFFDRLSEALPGFAGAPVSFSPLASWLLFAALLALAWLGTQGRLRGLVQGLLKPGLALVLLGAASVVAWRLALAAPDGRLRLTLLESGAGGQAGEALLVESPTGRFVLVGGGASATRLSDGLGRRLPPFDRRLDWLVLAGSGEEQLAALPAALERFPVSNVLWAGPHGASRAARSLEESLSALRLQPVEAQEGHALDLGQGARLEVLALTPRGAVLLLAWENFHALLPLGLDFEAMEALNADPGLCHIEVLLLADCGYAASNPPEWIARLRPQLALLSVAAGDREGRPDPETLEALAGYTLLRTDLHGWIEVSTDGERMWVEAARQRRVERK